MATKCPRCGSYNTECINRVEQNMEEAVKWWRLAAEQGDEKAKEALKSLQNE